MIRIQIKFEWKRLGVSGAEQERILRVGEKVLLIK